MSTAKIAGRGPRRFLFWLGRGVMRRRLLQGAAVLSCAGFAVAHVVLLLWTQYKGLQSGIVNWPVLLAPAVVTVVFLPSWRHWRRWALFYFIVFTCNPVLLPQVLVLTETVVLYTVWVRDRHPGDLGWIRLALSGTVRRVTQIAGPALRLQFSPARDEARGNPPCPAAKPSLHASVGPVPKRSKHQRARAHANRR